MKLRLPILVSFVLIAAMAAMSVWAWGVLPDGARLVSHWGFDGRANGTMSKETGLILMPAICAGVVMLLALIPYVEPRREHLIASRKAFVAVWLGALVVLAATHAMIVLSAMGYALDVPGVLMVLVAALIAVAGNYLGKVRSNFFLGIRTPWTLSSELSWEKSHRLLGRLFVFSALAALATDLAIGTEAGFAVLVAGLSASALAGVVGSYVFWKHDPERRGA